MGIADALDRFGEIQVGGGIDPPRVPILTLTQAAVRPVTDVRAFGAMGDGVTDDTIAIRTAIGRTRDGGVVYFPAGTYLLFGPGNWGNFLWLSDRRCLTFRGDGAGCSVIRRADGPLGDFSFLPMFIFAHCEELAIEDLAIDGNGVANWGDEAETNLGIYVAAFVGCRGIRIERTRWLDSRLAHVPSAHGGVALLFGDTLDADGTGCDDVAVVDNAFDQTGLWIARGHRIKINNNRLTGGPRSYSIRVAAATFGVELSDVEITDNLIVDSNGTGIWWHAKNGETVGSRRVRIAENSILRSQERGILIERSGSSARDFIVEGNLVQNREGSGRLVSGRRLSDLEAAIMILGATSRSSLDNNEFASSFFEDLVVRNNTVIGFRSRGITVTGCDKSTITGNAVLDCQEGIHLEALKRTHIASNRVSVLATGYALIDSLGFNVFAGNAALHELGGLDERTAGFPSDHGETDVVVAPLGS